MCFLNSIHFLNAKLCIITSFANPLAVLRRQGRRKVQCQRATAQEKDTLLLFFLSRYHDVNSQCAGYI